MQIDPKKDGIDHLNVYAMGKTEFGRFFSNMQDSPIELPYLGSFRTIEGLWYYLKDQDDRYRTATGFDVKKLGKLFKESEDSKLLPPEVFQYIIRNAIIRKAKQHGGLELCRKPEYQNLPLKHYLVYGKNHPNPKVIDITEKFQWWLDIIDFIRTTANK